MYSGHRETCISLYQLAPNGRTGIRLGRLTHLQTRTCHWPGWGGGRGEVNYGLVVIGGWVVGRGILGLKVLSVCLSVSVFF